MSSKLAANMPRLSNRDLLAGMERISVDLWQFVVTGEPVAVMGDGAQSAVAKAGGVSQPVLYVEFRKDGVPVDPGPGDRLPLLLYAIPFRSELGRTRS